MKSKLNYILMFLAIFIFLIGIFIENITTILIGVLILWLSNIVYSFFDIKNRIVFLMFNATFFIFLLGRITVTGIFKYKEGYTGILGTAFNDYEVIYTMLLVLFLSLL
ncbi:O-antigen polysaccharide polymerase Wzy, partial [Vagococcus fessus]